MGPLCPIERSTARAERLYTHLSPNAYNWIMAGNFHLSPNACSSGFDDDSDSEDEPILTFTQKCRALPPKRIPKKKKVLDEENESQFKRAPLKEKDDKKKKAVRQPEKTKRSPVKKKFGVSPNPKRVKKVKKKMIEAAQKKNADVGDENGGGADGNENDENTNPNDGSRPNTFLRDSLHCFEVVEVVEDAGEALYGFKVRNDPVASTIGAAMPAEIDANDDPLVDALLGPLLEDDGVAAQPVGTTGTMAPAAHGGVAQPARAQLPRAPPLAAQAAPAAPSERAQDHSDSDEVQTRARRAGSPVAVACLVCRVCAREKGRTGAGGGGIGGEKQAGGGGVFCGSGGSVL